MGELRLLAKTENLQQVLSFVNGYLEENGCPAAAIQTVEIVAEEIFVNIASYAYGSEEGEAVVRVEMQDSPRAAVITFIDSGIPFDPLAKKAPDLSLSAEERQIGGLGILMVRKLMDRAEYAYQDRKNILTVYKNIE